MNYTHLTDKEKEEKALDAARSANQSQREVMNKKEEITVFDVYTFEAGVEHEKARIRGVIENMSGLEAFEENEAGDEVKDVLISRRYLLDSLKEV